MNLFLTEHFIPAIGFIFYFDKTFFTKYFTPVIGEATDRRLKLFAAQLSTAFCYRAANQPTSSAGPCTEACGGLKVVVGSEGAFWFYGPVLWLCAGERRESFAPSKAQNGPPV